MMLQYGRFDMQAMNLKETWKWFPWQSIKIRFIATFILQRQMCVSTEYFSSGLREIRPSPPTSGLVR
jgi:hypothetical protein